MPRYTLNIDGMRPSVGAQPDQPLLYALTDGLNLNLTRREFLQTTGARIVQAGGVLAIGGAGEPAIVCFPAAIANAVADATGVRIRRYPLVPERVKRLLD